MIMQSILVVDDEPMAREILISQLRTKYTRIDVYQADNGVNALAMLKHITPDVVVFDINMPNMNGSQLVR